MVSQPWSSPLALASHITLNPPQVQRHARAGTRPRAPLPRHDGGRSCPARGWACTPQPNAGGRGAALWLLCKASLAPAWSALAAPHIRLHPSADAWTLVVFMPAVLPLPSLAVSVVITRIHIPPGLPGIRTKQHSSRRSATSARTRTASSARSRPAPYPRTWESASLTQSGWTLSRAASPRGFVPAWRATGQPPTLQPRPVPGPVPAGLPEQN